MITITNYNSNCLYLNLTIIKIKIWIEFSQKQKGYRTAFGKTVAKI